MSIRTYFEFKFFTLILKGLVGILLLKLPSVFILNPNHQRWFGFVVCFYLENNNVYLFYYLFSIFCICFQYFVFVFNILEFISLFK